MAEKKDPCRFSGRFKKDANKEIFEFAKMQYNFSDAITYLIEKEIHENGLRDLSQVIPPVRSSEFFNNISDNRIDNKIKPEFNDKDIELRLHKNINEINRANEDIVIEKAITTELNIEKNEDDSKIEDIPDCYKD